MMGTMKYASLDLGTVEAVVNKLGGMDGVKRFLSGELVITRVFSTWKTIKLGTGLRTAKDFRDALKQLGYKACIWADDMLDQEAFTATETETDADLVVVSVKELGFGDGAKRADIYTRAQELGLSLCPAEVGPQLCLQYADQPHGEHLIIAMEPISILGSPLSGFGVTHNDYGRYLDGRGHGGNFWGGDRRWVFMKPRK